MSFPALTEFPLDPIIAVYPVTQRVYLRLLSMLDFTEPRAVKAFGLAEELCVRPQTVAHAMHQLVERGFLVDHGRTANKVRLFTLCWSRGKPLALERTTSAA